jgi:two-component system, NarL family, sensor histidine kinase DegS
LTIDTPPADTRLADLAARARGEVETLDRELAEIDMLVVQAKSEAGRHEAKREQVAEKLTALAGNRSSDPKELGDLNAQLLTLTKRATMMESQVDVLAGKQKALVRYREALARYADELGAMVASTALVPVAPGELQPGTSTAGTRETAAAGPQAGVSRLVVDAQEDLRREIAREMHDGPAQSLTNIVLQAQIVDRLLSRNVEMAKAELRQLISMVQSTLDATKSFIFDVRPMVLDDLGLVPTLRRAARDRGRRAQIPVEFDSMGADRRLPMELESALFRMLDDALVGYLAGRPDRVLIRLDWSDEVEAQVVAHRDELPAEAEVLPTAKPSGKWRVRGKGSAPAEEMPAALAAMIEDRRAAEASAAAAARRPVALPPETWREIQERAATIGVTAELLGEGAELRLVASVPLAG